MGLFDRLRSQPQPASEPEAAQTQGGRPYDLISEALTHWQQQNPVEADRLFRLGIDAYRRTEPEGVDFALGRYGAFLLDQGRAAEALNVLEEAIRQQTRIPAIWIDYLAILAEQRDEAALFAAANGMRDAVGSNDSDTTEILLAHARRADRDGDSRFAEAIARRVMEDAAARGEAANRWAAAGDLGHILERAGRMQEAIQLWRQAFEEGSDDPVTANRLSLHLERARDYEGSARMIREALKRGLPANTEEQLRKRLTRCEAKGQPPSRGRTRPDVQAFSVRHGEGVLEPLFQLRMKPPIRDLEILGDTARCLGVSKGVGTLTDIDATTGQELRRLDGLPGLHDTWFAPNGFGLGIERSGRIGDPATKLSFFDPSGSVTRQAEIPDAASEIALGPNLWFVGCRDGRLYAFALDGEDLWAWETPGSGTYEGSPYFRPCPYFVASTGSSCIVSSMGDIYAVSPSGATLWHVELPNEERTSYTITMPLGEEAPAEPEAHRTLGLRTGATFEEIKSAYRRQALATHPDRNPEEPEAGAAFIKVQAAYETIMSRPTLSGHPTFVELSMQITGMGPLVSSLNANGAGIVAGSTQGRLYLLDVSGRIDQVRALGRSRVDAILHADGTLAAAWCDGALSFFRNEAVINAADVPDPPKGMVALGEEVLHWRRNRVELTDALGRDLWAAEFSKTIAGLAAVGERVVCGAGVLTGFRRPTQASP